MSPDPYPTENPKVKAATCPICSWTCDKGT